MYKTLILLILIPIFSCSEAPNPNMDKYNNNISTLFSSNISYISDDTYKCIYNSEIQYFIIKNNKEKDHIFVSFSNTNIQLYNGGKHISKLNYITYYIPKYDDYYIISKGIGCFQVIYLEKGCFNVDKKNKSLEKTFNILNSKIYEFSLCNEPNQNGDKDYIIYIYSSENNFINKLIIERYEQDLNIKKKKDQYYYKFEHSQRGGWSNTELNINFSLHNKDHITISLDVELDYLDPMVWVYIVIGSLIGVPVCYFGIKYIIKCYKERKENEKKRISRIELNNSLLNRSIDSKLNKMKLEEQKRIEYKKKEEKKKKIFIDQLMKKSSILYGSILKNNNLLNQVCLLCGKMNNEIQQYKKYYENENYENEEYEDEDYEDENYENDDSKNYDDEIDKMELIEDINNNKYNSFIEYITPTKCKHFYHKSCVDKYEFKYGVYFNCYFCKFFITVENMKKFGCFFSKEIFNNILVGRYDNSIDHDNTKKKIIKNIEKDFYHQIENSYFLNKRKKEKLLKLKNINEKFLRRFYSLNKYRNNKLDYYKYYELSIKNDMDKEEEELNDEIQYSEELNESKKREKEERREREREREERERERYEEERERQRERKKNNKPINLKICHNCNYFCVLCKQRIPSGLARHGIFYKAHSSCYRDDLCIICGKIKGMKPCYDICAYCSQKSHPRSWQCFYCKKNF